MSSGAKRFKTRVVVGTDISGKPICKWATGATEAEMLERKQLLIDKYIVDANNVSKQDVMFGQYAVDWFRVYKVGPGGLKASTLSGYKSALNNHILPMWGNRIIRAIKPLELQSWVNSLSGKRNGTVEEILLMCRQIFAQAFADGTIDRNPMVGIHKPRTVELKRNEVPDDQIASLDAAARRLMLEGPSGAMAALLFYIPYMTGLRRGEFLGLTGEDIDFGSRLIHVRREVVYVRGRLIVYDLSAGDRLKTDAAARDVPMPEELCNLLREYGVIGRRPLFVGPKSGKWVCHSTYKRLWLRLVREAGLDKLPETDKITPHRLRHTYSSITRRAQLDIKERQYIMGHADPEITDGRYTHINNADLMVILGKLDTFFSGAKAGAM
mgnify:CR=1 FL=1